MDNDLGFLLIFIILPTALIVSGIWFLVLIRKDARTRELSQASTQANVASDDTAETELPSVDERGEPVVVAPLPVTAPTDLEQDRLAPDDEATEDVEDVEEFWTTLPDTQALPLPDAVRDPVKVRSVPPEPEPKTVSGYTEEITPVDDDTDSESAPSPDVEPDSDPSDETGVSADRKDESEQKEPENRPERRRRQPGARLVPSNENVKKRTSTSPRRPPPIARSTGRDEDSVERPDGSHDV